NAPSCCWTVVASAESGREAVGSFLDTSSTRSKYGPPTAAATSQAVMTNAGTMILNQRGTRVPPADGSTTRTCDCISRSLRRSVGADDRSVSRLLAVRGRGLRAVGPDSSTGASHPCTKLCQTLYTRRAHKLQASITVRRHARYRGVD